jgi:16S rRNA (adenine1518-N6/adenine1519-N6)-dimethyltransferase
MFYPPQGKIRLMRMRRKEDLVCLAAKSCSTVVKTAFQQRRKTLRNSLKTLNLSDALREDLVLTKTRTARCSRFIALTQKIEADGI